MERLLRLFYQHILQLTEYCITSEDGGYSALDFQDVELDDEDIDDILNELEEDE